MNSKLDYAKIDFSACDALGVTSRSSRANPDHRPMNWRASGRETDRHRRVTPNCHAAKTATHRASRSIEVRPRPKPTWRGAVHEVQSGRRTGGLLGKVQRRATVRMLRHRGYGASFVPGFSRVDIRSHQGGLGRCGYPLGRVRNITSLVRPLG